MPAPSIVSVLVVIAELSECICCFTAARHLTLAGKKCGATVLVYGSDKVKSSDVQVVWKSCGVQDVFRALTLVLAECTLDLRSMFATCCGQFLYMYVMVVLSVF